MLLYRSAAVWRLYTPDLILVFGAVWFDLSCYFLVVVLEEFWEMDLVASCKVLARYVCLLMNQFKMLEQRFQRACVLVVSDRPGDWFSILLSRNWCFKKLYYGNMTCSLFIDDAMVSWWWVVHWEDYCIVDSTDGYCIGGLLRLTSIFRLSLCFCLCFSQSQSLFRCLCREYMVHGFCSQCFVFIFV